MDFKTLKAGLQQAFATIQQATEHAELPEITVVSGFVRLSRLMQTLADDHWVEEAGDFAHMAEKLLQAVKQGSVEESVLCVESLDEAQTYCHRMFRD
jgi:XXXCH domain-containing protein